ncbi:hypothetical protein [Acinetobacter albensis]|uniref:Uncharacterized protein n=1 Tax=Acinetobacter albensis TaxID=1673609 RepID=A0A1C4GRW7_9GAMM|nr:hypothetical protein [Acinetobacter albensis]SCC70920.1 hypothetical protein GA0116959_1026 [Acinetobacter albensis]
MFFDWACIYSDDKVSTNKGHQYRSGSLDLNSSQKTELKSFFYIPSNFPKIPVISGKWFDNINKMAIGATQILPNEGRTSYLTFIIFLSKEECSSIIDIYNILKYIINDPTKLKAICDLYAKEKIFIELEVNNKVNDEKIEIYNKAKNIIVTLYDLYAKRENGKPVVQDGILNSQDYILILSLVWSFIFPSLRHEFHWFGLIKHIDIPFDDLPKIIFTDKISQQWESSFISKKIVFANEIISTPLSEYYTNNFFNKTDTQNILDNYLGGLEDLYLLSNYFTYLKGFNLTDDTTFKINNLLSVCSSLNLLLSRGVISQDYFSSYYLVLQKDLYLLLSEVVSINQLKRFFADKYCLLSTENLKFLKNIIINFIQAGQCLDKAILAHSAKFDWVKIFFLDVYSNINYSHKMVIKSILLTITQELDEIRSSIFVNFISRSRETLFKNFLIYDYFKEEFVVSSYSLFIDFFKNVDWGEFSIIFSIISLTVVEDNNKKLFAEILKKIEIYSLYLEEFKSAIKSILGSDKFTELYIEFSEVVLLDVFILFFAENLKIIKGTKVSKNIIDIIIKILPTLSSSDKSIYFNQEYFDLLLKFMIDKQLKGLISVLLVELNGVKDLHFYNLSYKEREILWVLAGSMKYLRPTTLRCISKNTPITTIETTLFKDINIFLVENSANRINSYLVDYLKDPRVIYSVEHKIVLNILSYYMSSSEMNVYISKMKVKKDAFKRFVDIFKSNNKTKLNKLRDYHRIIILENLSLEEKLDACSPNHLTDVDINFSQWVFSFQECLTNLISSRLELENICQSSGLKYKNFPNGNSISEFVSIVVSKVFNQKIINPSVFFNSIQIHIGIEDSAINYDILNSYKLFILLKRYYVLKF